MNHDALDTFIRHENVGSSAEQSQRHPIRMAATYKPRQFINIGRFREILGRAAEAKTVPRRQRLRFSDDMFKTVQPAHLIDLFGFLVP